MCFFSWLIWCMGSIYQFDWNFQGSLGPNGSDSLPCRRDTELPHERPVPWADVQKSFEKNCFFFLSEFQTLEEALLQSSISGLVHYIKHCCLIGLCNSLFRNKTSTQVLFNGGGFVKLVDIDGRKVFEFCCVRMNKFGYKDIHYDCQCF